MAQPTRYTRKYDFENHSTLYPTTPQPGVQMESELDAIKVTTDEICNNLALIQRDDGALASRSVGLAQLQTGLVVGVNPATNWLTATAYDEGDTVYESNKLYYCAIAHTSGTFATDLAALKWVLILNFDQFVAAAAASAAAALVSEGNAATSETNASNSASTAGTAATNAGNAQTAAENARDAALAAQTAAESAASSLNFSTIQAGDAGKHVKVNATENGYDYETVAIPVKATTAEIDTGTDDAKFITADGLAASDYGLQVVPIWLTSPTGQPAAASTTDLNYYDVPSNLDGWNLVAVKAKCAVAGTTGTMTIDIHKNGTTVMSANKLVVASGATVDNGTAAITTNTVADGDVYSVLCDGVHTAPATGVRALLYFRKP